MSELYEDSDSTSKLEEAIKKIVFTEELPIEKKTNHECCSICLESVDNKPQLIMTTECGHIFHYRECWKKFFEGRDDSKINSICRPCPMCRRLVMYDTGAFFQTLEYIKALEEAIIDGVDDDFHPLFYNTETSEEDIDRILEITPSFFLTPINN